MSRSSDAFDAAIVGGGPAGLSAALTLARAGRRTVVFDAGAPRNAPAAHSHGFLTRDGTPPAELRRLGRAEVEGYGGTIRQAEVAGAARTDGGFRLTTADGSDVTARVLILATGVVDELPGIPGLAGAWGRSAVHCPYCHGHEHRGKPTALLGRGDTTFDEARLLLGWTDDLTVVTNGPEDLDDAQEAALAAEGVRIVRTRIARLRAPGGQVEAVVFEDGTEIPCGVFYVQPPQRPRSDLAARLGAALDADGHPEVEAYGRTAVPGLFVVGDVTGKPQTVAAAVAEGALAGMAANYELVVGPQES